MPSFRSVEESRPIIIFKYSYTISMTSNSSDYFLRQKSTYAYLGHSFPKATETLAYASLWLQLPTPEHSQNIPTHYLGCSSQPPISWLAGMFVKIYNIQAAIVNVQMCFRSVIAVTGIPYALAVPANDGLLSPDTPANKTAITTANIRMGAIFSPFMSSKIPASGSRQRLWLWW